MKHVNHETTSIVPTGRRTTAETLTEQVLDRYAGTPDARLRQLLTSVITHLHALIRENDVTPAEWMYCIGYLTKAGQWSNDKRQEMILLSDNLGVSSLVELLAAATPQGATESTVVGPFYVPDTPDRAWGESIALRDTPGAETLIMTGRVTGLAGEPVPNAMLEIWQTDANGMYDIQEADQPENNLRGRYHADREGAYRVDTIRPIGYSIPTDGPVGDLVRATRRAPWRPGHVHALVSAPGYRSLITQLYDADSDYLDTDAVFAVKESLIVQLTPVTDPQVAQEFGKAAPFLHLAQDFVLTPE